MTDERAGRSDAARNRANLLAAASAAFASAGEPLTMRDLAARAGVGVGTLYRHFPTREALVDAVYENQAARLASGAEELLAHHPPAEALRRWMDLFSEWIAAKRGMLATMLAQQHRDGSVQTQSRQQTLSAIELILRQGGAAGELRDDVDAEDVSAALVGLLMTSEKHNSDRTSRLLDVLVDGLRARGAASRPGGLGFTAAAGGCARRHQ